MSIYTMMSIICVVNLYVDAVILAERHNWRGNCTLQSCKISNIAGDYELVNEIKIYQLHL